jgi:hypothetical protein
MKELQRCWESHTNRETHKYEIMRQLGVQTTAGLIRYAVRVQLV